MNLPKRRWKRALWDVFGKRYGLPVYRLLGGAAHERVPVLTVLHVADPEEMADEAEALVASGLRRLKLKIGFGVDADEAMVARVRERLGPSIALRADAEESYTAKTRCRSAGDYRGTIWNC